MIINLSPQRSDDTLEVIKNGDVLTINGDVLDLSTIPEGATLPHGAISNPFVFGKVERLNGHVQLTLLLPHGENPPAQVAFPAQIIDPPDGPVQLPSAPPEA